MDGRRGASRRPVTQGREDRGSVEGGGEKQLDLVDIQKTKWTELVDSMDMGSNGERGARQDAGELVGGAILWSAYGEGLRLGSLIWGTLGRGPGSSFIWWLQQLSSGPLNFATLLSVAFDRQKSPVWSLTQEVPLVDPPSPCLIAHWKTTSSEACSKNLEAGVPFLPWWPGVLRQNACSLWPSVFPKYAQISHRTFVRCK